MGWFLCMGVGCVGNALIYVLTGSDLNLCVAGAAFAAMPYDFMVAL